MLPIDPDDALLRALRLARDGVGADAGDDAPDTGAFDATVLHRIGRALADGPDADAGGGPVPAPPAHLWDAIAAELGLPEASAAAGPVDRAGSGPAAAPVGTVAPAGSEPDGADGRVVPFAPRSRSRRWVLPALAAAAAVVVAVVAVGTGRGGPEVVAEVALQPLEGNGSGEAKVLLRSDGGHRVEVVEQFGGVPSGSYVEVWLIDPTSNLERMVSLGTIRGDGTYDLPEGIDIRQYRVVDVSIEPADGVPTHSGRSILRAELPLPPA